jgi:glycosyltransferase involved in cell wall biosynthesis
MDKLAIVIPAYKKGYLHETLKSLSLQTNKNFRVYIGDDNSPEDIGSVVRCFEGQFDFVYQRFDDNLGGKDLVAQWERCIALTQDENWIWLFSDDDYMDPTCVEDFYKCKLVNAQPNLFRFNTTIVDENANHLRSCIFPPLVSSDFLLVNRLRGRIDVFAVEYIFSRDVYEKSGGFQNFDLAWGSDTATWMKFGINGICTIPSSHVFWRKSNENITGRKEDKKTIIRKLQASNMFLMWAKNFCRDSHTKHDLIIDFSFIRRIHGAAINVPIKECLDISSEYIGKAVLRRFFMVSLSHVYHYICIAAKG